MPSAVRRRSCKFVFGAWLNCNVTIERCNIPSVTMRWLRGVNHENADVSTWIPTIGVGLSVVTSQEEVMSGRLEVTLRYDLP
jgi:hypothetical protein